MQETVVKTPEGVTAMKISTNENGWVEITIDTSTVLFRPDRAFDLARDIWRHAENDDGG